jgi:hypothetical protein
LKFISAGRLIPRAMERRDVLRDRADNSGDVENDVGVQRLHENVERRQENDENNENNEDG